MEEVFQNNAEGATKEHEIERGFLMLVHQNDQRKYTTSIGNLVDHIYSCILGWKEVPAFSLMKVDIF